MARYYFDMRDGQGLFADEEGLECPDLDAVQKEAARSLADMARDSIYEAADAQIHRMTIEVRDGSGPVMKVAFLFEVTRQN